MSRLDRRSPYEKRRTRRVRQPYRKPFRLRHIVQVKPRPGSYTFYGARGTKLYSGSSKQLGPSEEDPKRQGRLLDVYYSRGEYRTSRFKRRLRPKINKFDIHYHDNVYDNRERERREKRGLPYNIR